MVWLGRDDSYYGRNHHKSQLRVSLFRQKKKRPLLIRGALGWAGACVSQAGEAVLQALPGRRLRRFRDDIDQLMRVAVFRNGGAHLADVAAVRFHEEAVACTQTRENTPGPHLVKGNRHDALLCG